MILDKIKEIAASAVIPMVKGVAKEEMVNALEKFKELNPHLNESMLKGLHANFTLLDDVAQKTKTKIDDCFIDVVLEAVSKAAEESGVTL